MILACIRYTPSIKYKTFFDTMIVSKNVDMEGV
jgi:hypothetical protein